MLFPQPPFRLRPVLLLLLVLVALGNLAFWRWLSAPVTLADSWDQPVASMSFAPFHKGQSPLTKIYPSAAEIEEDLKGLVGKAKGIRTYTSREGMQVVPALAQKYGIELTQSAWLGHEPPRDPGEAGINPAEVSALIKQANAYPDVIKRVIVGNEVLLRKDLPVDKLIDYIRQVKRNVKQPVSYADVWAFYLKYPQVADEVDFITIHILPYWEDEPLSVEASEDYIVKVVRTMKERFPGKPILIGEAGWPTAGRDRGPAIPSVENGAKFVRMLARVSAREGFDYNVVEAFDQPWKSKMEGTIGANWGVVDIDRQAKFSLSGPVEPLKDWPLRATIAIILGALLGLLAGGKASTGKIGQLVFLALFANGMAIAVTQAGFEDFAIAYFPWQLAWGGIKLAVVAAYGLVLLLAAAGGESNRLSRRLPLVIGGAAVVWAGLIAFDGRYRDIPVGELLVPAFGTLILAGWKRRIALSDLLGSDGVTEFWAKYLAFLLPLSALATLAGEGWSVVGDDFLANHPDLSDQILLILQAAVTNREILLFALILVLLSLPFRAEARRHKLV